MIRGRIFSTQVFLMNPVRTCGGIRNTFVDGSPDDSTFTLTRRLPAVAVNVRLDGLEVHHDCDSDLSSGDWQVAFEASMTAPNGVTPVTAPTVFPRPMEASRRTRGWVWNRSYRRPLGFWSGLARYGTLHGPRNADTVTGGQIRYRGYRDLWNGGSHAIEIRPPCRLSHPLVLVVPDGSTSYELGHHARHQHAGGDGDDRVHLKGP